MNALGSVAGTLLGTFVLVALLGTRGALLLLAWLPVPLALWALCEAHPRRRLAPLVAAALVGGLAGASALAAPAGFYRGLFEQRFGRVLWFSEGVSETVAVCEYKDGSRWIQFSDGRGASGTCSYQGGWLYAHLPLLLHPPAAVGGGDLLRHRQHARRPRACTPSTGSTASSCRARWWPPHRSSPRPTTASPRAAARGS